MAYTAAMNGAESLARTLVACGIDTCFAYRILQGELVAACARRGPFPIELVI